MVQEPSSGAIVRFNWDEHPKRYRGSLADNHNLFLVELQGKPPQDFLTAWKGSVPGKGR